MTVAEAGRLGAASRLSGQRVAIVMMSAIGDAVHVLPVANALKRHAPDCHLTWIIQPLPATLVRGHDAIDEIIEFDPYAGLTAWLGLRRQLRRRRFDLVLDLQVALKGGLVTALIRARRKLGFDRRRARDANWLFTTERIEARPPQHVQDQYFEFLEHLGVPAEPVEWRIGPWPDERAWQREFHGRFSRPLAALNIATSDPDRDWRPEHWARVADALHERYGLQTVVVGGPSAREKELAATIRSMAHHPPVSALGSGLRPLVAILDGAALVLALDSAPLHIAVALDRPVISLMSNADPRRTGPYRRFHDLIIDAYHDPGEQAPVSMTRRPGRMDRITLDDVLAKVERWDQRYRSNG
jgi:heptosyltransferase I